MISRRRVLHLALASSAALLSGTAQAQQWRPPSQRSTAPPLMAPPAPRHERHPTARTGYTWVPGHWRWSSRYRRYVWEEGHWERTRPGMRYVGGRWVYRRGEWSYIPGQWMR